MTGQNAVNDEAKGILRHGKSAKRAVFSLFCVVRYFSILQHNRPLHDFRPLFLLHLHPNLPSLRKHAILSTFQKSKRKQNGLFA